MTVTYRYDCGLPFGGTEPDIIVVTDDAYNTQLSIPIDEANMQYVELMRAVEAGTVTIEPMPPPRKPYDPFNWYWVVAEKDPGRVYATGQDNDHIPIDDPEHVAWLASGGIPTHIDTEYSLGIVLGAYYPQLRPIPAGVLDGYVDKVAGVVITDEEFAVLFNHENRLRAMEGLPAIVVGQTRAVFGRQIRRTRPPAIAELEKAEKSKKKIDYGEDT